MAIRLRGLLGANTALLPWEASRERIRKGGVRIVEGGGKGRGGELEGETEGKEGREYAEKSGSRERGARIVDRHHRTCELRDIGFPLSF
jgi:hypothetical protein